MALEWKWNKVVGMPYAETREGSYTVFPEDGIWRAEFTPTDTNERINLGWKYKMEDAATLAEVHNANSQS